MEIMFFSVLLTIITWVGYYLYDKRSKKKGNQFSNEDDKPGSKLINYSEYHMTKKEKLFYFLIAFISLFIIGLIFYQNLIISTIFGLFGFFYPKIRKKELIKKRKQELNLQFKQALYTLSSALGAGKSVETAFREVINDLKLLYPDPNALIIKEIEVINHRIENGEPIENAIRDFSLRADLEDIASFADVFIVCKRSGGDLIEVIRRTSNIIGDKLDIQQEISVLISQKKLESKILLFIPVLFVGFLSMSAPDYMAPLYQLGIGPIIMTVSLLLLVGAQIITKWIMDIKV